MQNVDYHGTLVCGECGKRHYPNPEEFKWLGVVDVATNEFFTLPFYGVCFHCGKMRKCAFRLKEEEVKDGIISITE